MDDREKLSYAKAVPAFGKVRHEEFVGYIIAMARRRKADGGQWVNEEHPYLAVDGRIAMARVDHARQEKRLDFCTEIVLEDERLVRVRATVISEVYGTVTAYADSRFGAQGVESQRPVEVAETSALGRALGMLGYGLLPGTGLTSAEDMERAQAPNGQMQPQETRRVPLLSEEEIRTLTQLTQEWTGLDWEKAFARLTEMCVERFGREPRELDQDDGKAIVAGLRKVIADKAAKKIAPAPEQVAQPEPGGYLASATAWRSTMAHLVNNGAREGDAKATMEGWLEEKYTHEQVLAELAKWDARRYQQRFFATIKEMGVSKELAYRHLGIEHLEELQGEALDVVRGRLQAAMARGKEGATATA